MTLKDHPQFEELQFRVARENKGKKFEKLPTKKVKKDEDGVRCPKCDTIQKSRICKECGMQLY